MPDDGVALLARHPETQAPAADAAFRAAVARFLPRLRPCAEGGPWLQTLRGEAAREAAITPGPRDTAITVPDPGGWLRILAAPLAGGALRAATHEVVLKARTEREAEVAIEAVLLLAGDPGGRFRPVTRLAQRRMLGPDWQELHFRLPAAAAQGLIGTEEAAVPFFATLVLAGPVALRVGAFALQPVPVPASGGAPYLESPLPAAAELAELNRSLSKDGRRKLGDWLLRALDLALRLDCHDTAAGLLPQLDAALAPEDRERRGRALALAAQLGIVTGATEALADRLYGGLDLVLSDDRLTTALSACLEPEPRHLPLVGRLPSGRPNRFFLSRLDPAPEQIAAAGAALGADLPADPAAAAEERAQRMLFLASQLRVASPIAARGWLNRAFGEYGLAPATRLDLGAETLLETLEFAEAPAPPAGGPKVSVVMAACEAAATLGYAARSILGQTHREIELLLCDDGSMDGTWEVARRIQAQDPRVRLFRSRANQGPYNIRNALIERATGDYLTFADADDVAHPERIARQVTAFAPDGGEPPVAVVGRWIRMMPDGRIPFSREQRAVRLAVVSLMAPTEVFRDRLRYRPVLCGADSEAYETLRFRHGPHAIREIAAPLIVGLWSTGSLTRRAGIEATEDGYRSPARLAYAEVAARQRLFGPAVVTDADVEALTRAHGIHRDPTGVEEVARPG